MKKRKNINWAIHVADPAWPENPRAPATIPATIKNDKTQAGIFHHPLAGNQTMLSNQVLIAS
jgi:hypothetical protein